MSLEQSLADHDVVICDRYVASNVAHQGAKVSGTERQQAGYSIDWTGRRPHSSSMLEVSWWLRASSTSTCIQSLRVSVGLISSQVCWTA